MLNWESSLWTNRNEGHINIGYCANSNLWQSSNFSYYNTVIVEVPESKSINLWVCSFYLRVFDQKQWRSNSKKLDLCYRYFYNFNLHSNDYFLFPMSHKDLLDLIGSLKNTNLAVSQLKKKDLLVYKFAEFSRKGGTEKNEVKLPIVVIYI